MNVAPTAEGERPSNLRQLTGYCLERDTLRRSVKTALVVGSILALINHGQQFLSGQSSASWIIPMLVTYLVPFSVATYGDHLINHFTPLGSSNWLTFGVQIG